MVRSNQSGNSLGKESMRALRRDAGRERKQDRLSEQGERLTMKMDGWERGAWQVPAVLKVTAGQPW